MEPNRLSGHALVAALLTFPGLAMAQAADTAARTETPTEEAKAQAPEQTASKASLDAISVTATRSPIKAFDYPGMVTVVGPEEIQTRQPSSPDDVLSFIPNVEFTGGPRRTGETPSIRGFSGPDVIVLIDGARQNFNGAHDGRFFVDPSMLSEIEVLRGPASALYGSGGTGGILAFRTLRAEDLLRPGDTAGVRTQVGYATVDREEFLGLTAFARPDSEWDVIANAIYRNPGSIRLGDGSELTNADDDLLSGLFKTTWTPGGGHQVQVSWLGFRNDALEPNVGQGAGGNDLVEKEIVNQNATVRWHFDSPDSDLIDIDAQVYTALSGVDELRLDNNGAGPQGELLKRDVTTLGFRLDNRSETGWLKDGKTTLVYGLEGYQDIQNGAAGNGERDGVPDARHHFAGVFGQGEFRLFEPFGAGLGDVLLLPGVRFDYYSARSAISGDVTDVAASPRVGASWFPLPWAMAFANYSRAFRAPSFDEAFLDGVHFQIPVGAGVVNRFVANPDLDPQRTTTFEVGFGLDFRDIVKTGDKLTLKATRFWIDGKDFIDLQVIQPTLFVDCNPFIPGNCDGTTRSVNIPNALLEGNEIEAHYENSLVRLVFGFSNIDGEDSDTGAKLGVLTPAQVTLDAGLKIADYDLLVGTRILGAFDFDKVDAAADERPGYVVNDIYMTWAPRDPLLDGLRLDVGVDNVFDRAYSRVFNNAFEPGRNYKARVAYTARW